MLMFRANTNLSERTNFIVPRIFILEDHKGEGKTYILVLDMSPNLGGTGMTIIEKFVHLLILIPISFGLFSHISIRCIIPRFLQPFLSLWLCSSYLSSKVYNISSYPSFLLPSSIEECL